MKLCPKCLESYEGKRCKPCWASYMKEYSKNYRKTEEYKKKAKEYKARNQEKHREYKLNLRFGVTVEQYDAMLASQGGVCAICGKPEQRPAAHGVGMRRLSIDHDHRTGRVRSLLCGRCNTTLGLLEESTELVDALRAYLVAQKER